MMFRKNFFHAKCCAGVFRVLKPGGSFIDYDCCLADFYNPENEQHIESKSDIETPSALSELHNQLSNGFVI